MSLKPFLHTFVATLLLTAALTSCAPEPEAAHEHPPAAGVEDAAPDFHGGHPRTPETPAVWDAAAEQAASDTATATMTAYVAHQGKTREEWWQNLAPHLDAIALRDYAWLNPEIIPASKLTGAVTVTQGETSTLAYAEAPTDAGVFTLTLSRKDGASGWEAGRIAPPQGLN